MTAFVLFTLVFIAINTNETVSKGSFIRVAPDSLYQISLPTDVEHIEHRVSNREFLTKGEVIARLKDTSGRKIGDIKAQIPGHFVKNPDCCKDKKNQVLGYLVKKNKNKVIFFQAINSLKSVLHPGDKVVIKSAKMELNGKVVMTIGNGSSSVKIVYGVNFEQQPDYHALVYEQPLSIHKVKPVNRLINRLLKEVFMIRL